MKKFVFLLLILSPYVYSSDLTNSDKYELCHEFYLLNKDIPDLTFFSNYKILYYRESSEFLKSKRKLFRIPSHIQILDTADYDKLILMPAFGYGGVKDDERFKNIRFSQMSHNDSVYLKNKYKAALDTTDLFHCYVSEINSIYEKYFQIRVPYRLRYINIPVIGERYYIIFDIYKNEDRPILARCYYIPNLQKLSSVEKEFFKHLKSFDKNWYYTIW